MIISLSINTLFTFFFIKILFQIQLNKQFPRISSFHFQSYTIRFPLPSFPVVWRVFCPLIYLSNVICSVFSSFLFQDLLESFHVRCRYVTINFWVKVFLYLFYFLFSTYWWLQITIIFGIMECPVPDSVYHYQQIIKIECMLWKTVHLFVSVIH